jgi:hypothetical protein
MPAIMEPEKKETSRPKKTNIREQTILTVKVLSIGGGLLGLLALVEWVVTP